MTPHPGDLLSGRYRLTELIAIGGMGQVWQARDEMLGRDIAVKILRPELARQAGFLARFRVEARHAARVSHANVAQIYDYGEVHDDGAEAPATSAFLVMELVPGEPLSAILAEEGPLEADRVLDLIAQAGWGLGAAHATGVVHRDVKPGNLMMTPDGLIKVTDFGVAVAKGDAALTETGQVMGTAQYLAPEQAVGEEVTPASDIYALGVVAYQCLADALPFPRDSAVATALAHVHDAVPELPDTVPPATAALVYAMLRKDPTERPANGRDVAATANSILAGFTPAVTSRMPTPDTSTLAYRSVAASGARAATGQSVLPARATRRRTFRLPLAALVALVALLIVLAISQGFNPSQDTDDPAPTTAPTPTGPAATPSRTTVTTTVPAPAQPQPTPAQTPAEPADPSPTQAGGNATGVLNVPAPRRTVTVTAAPSGDASWPPAAPLLPSPTPTPSDDLDPTPPPGP